MTKDHVHGSAASVRVLRGADQQTIVQLTLNVISTDLQYLHNLPQGLSMIWMICPCLAVLVYTAWRPYHGCARVCKHIVL